MSVQTTADEKLDEAKQAIKIAIKNLNEILIDECWGYDEFKAGYKQKMRDAQQLLIDAKMKLDN